MQVLNTGRENLHFFLVSIEFFPFFVEVVNTVINHGTIFHNVKLLGFW